MSAAGSAADFDEWLVGLGSWARHAGDAAGVWHTVGAQGLLSLAVPEKVGGTGAGYLAACRALAELAAAGVPSGTPFSLAAHMWACQEPLIAFGTDRQLDTYLPGMLGGELVGAFAATELDAGSDLLSLTTRARERGDGSWCLDGAKTFVTNGPVADVFIVLARTGDASSLSALSAFVLPRTTPGLSIGPDIAKAGLPGARLCALSFRDCVAPAESCLGPVGGGFAVLMRAMRYERAMILAPVIGVMERALRRAIDHARGRHQGGHSISTYQAIQQRLVMMEQSVSSARTMLHATATLADRGELDHMRASLTKLHVSTEFNRFSELLPDIYGGYCLLPDSGVMDVVADALASRYYSGTTDMQMKIVAEGLGL